MNGTIQFDTLKQLAEFLTEFAPSTATFEVFPRNGAWTLRFTGGY